MNPLHILIRKSGYSIYNGIQKRDLVSNIQHIDDALEIFRELSSVMTSHPDHAKHAQADWMVVPGVLAAE